MLYAVLSMVIVVREFFVLSGFYFVFVCFLIKREKKKPRQANKGMTAYNYNNVSDNMTCLVS